MVHAEVWHEPDPGPAPTAEIWHEPEPEAS